MTGPWVGHATIPQAAAQGPDSHRAIHGAMESVRFAAREDGIDPGTLRFSIHAPDQSQGIVLGPVDPITGATLPPQYLIRGTNDSGEPIT